jgi:DNA-binding XRE family transcriptional regulator
MDFKITMAAARVNAGLTQQELADKMQVTKQTIINWEKGRVIPKQAQFAMYCNICNVSQNYIFLPTFSTLSEVK